MAVHKITPSQEAAVAAGWGSVGFEQAAAAQDSRPIWRVLEKQYDHPNFGSEYATADTLEEAEAWAREMGMLARA